MTPYDLQVAFGEASYQRYLFDLALNQPTHTSASEGKDKGEDQGDKGDKGEKEKEEVK